jgi:GNAT superfamily N-acetyltransferase
LSILVELLTKDHDRTQFDCGVSSLNTYLQRQASQDQSRKVASVFVSCVQSARQVRGYYSLSSATISIDELSERQQKRLPHYPRVPATLIGRLAVDKQARGQGLGSLLLLDALARAHRASETVASYAVTVDVLEVQPDPLKFYEQYGFTRVRSHPRQLYLPMATIDQLLREKPGASETL